MHGRLWCPGVYGSRYQYARVHACTPVSCENYTRAHIGRRQVIMRDRRYGPILIVRIECGCGCCCCCCIRTGEGTQAALPAYTDPSKRYVRYTIRGNPCVWWIWPRPVLLSLSILVAAAVANKTRENILQKNHSYSDGTSCLYSRGRGDREW